MTARAFGAEARLLRHQRHLDLEQDRRAGRVQAGRHRASSTATATSRTTTASCWRARSRYYVEAFPLTQYSMYGAVPLRTIKQALLDCKAEGKLDRVKVIDLTNCTFDGHMYNPRG